MSRRAIFVIPVFVVVTHATGALAQSDEAPCPVAVANLFRAQSWLPPPLPPPPPPPPQAPPLPFVYLGQIQEGKGIAVFLGKQQQTLIVRAGETVDTNYRVEEVTPTLATFVFLPLGEKQQLPLRNTP